MVNLIATSVLAVFALVIAFRTVSLIVTHPHRLLTESVDLPAGIPISEIGSIEKELRHLSSVLVVAHKVEKPTSALAEAVEYNFSRGVKYKFLVSNDSTNEIRGYYKIFQAYADIVSARDGILCSEDLLEIQALPYKWDDYPYIFYTINLPSGVEKTLAFRGDQLHEGIADHYGRVDPILAHTIARAIISEPPRPLEDIQVDRSQFEDTSKVVEFRNPPASKVAL